MLLTFGNIKKSRMLRYVFHDDLPSKDYEEKMKQYRLTLDESSFSEYFKIERFLHDAKIAIEQRTTEVVLHLKGWDQEKSTEKRISLIFKYAKVLSWNKFRRSGHISRMNRPVVPFEFGYDEFYSDGNKKFVSIIIFTNHRNRTNVGTYYPMLTIEYGDIEIEEDA